MKPNLTPELLQVIVVLGIFLFILGIILVWVIGYLMHSRARLNLAEIRWEKVGFLLWFWKDDFLACVENLNPILIIKQQDITTLLTF